MTRLHEDACHGRASGCGDARRWAATISCDILAARAIWDWAGHPEVIEAACAAVRRYGVGTATSRSGYGNSPLVLEVERRAAEFFGSEAAFYYPSGYSGQSYLELGGSAGRSA